MMQPRLIYLRVISLVPQEAAGGDDDEEAWVAPVSFPRRPLSSPIYVYTEKKKTGFPKQHHGPSRLGFCGAAHHEEMAAITSQVKAAPAAATPQVRRPGHLFVSGG